MRIVEYRVVVPTNVKQYQIANLYVCAQRTREMSGGGEGVEILKNEPYEREDEKGQFTHKVMHFKSKVPSFIRWVIPDKYLHVHEISHNGYPHFHTVYNCPGMKDDFYLLVESQHLPYTDEKSCPDNALNLTEEELKERKIVWLDIVDGRPVPEKPEWDMRDYVCPAAKIETPLVGASSKGTPFPKVFADETKPPKWTLGYTGEMVVCVKVVKIKFKWFGLQTKVENYALDNVFPNTFTDSHRAMFQWADKWYTMTMEDIRKLEDEVQREQQNLEFDKDEEEK